VRRFRWFVVPVLIFTILSFTCIPVSAFQYRPVALDALREKADKAQPRDKCFLYARLINQMTDLADNQLNSGDSGDAMETLNAMRSYAERIHVDVTADAKNLKSAELLIQHTAIRLKGMLLEASFEDRPALETTLDKVDQVQAQLMLQVFNR
jgi:hypothetical protein